MTQSQKRWTLSLIAFLLLGMLLLASSLPNLRVTPGQPFRLETPSENETQGDSMGELMPRFFIFMRGILAAAVIILPIYIIISLLTRPGRRRLINDLIRLAVIALFLYVLNKRNQQFLQDTQLPGTTTLFENITQSLDAPLAVFTPAQQGWVPAAIIALIAVAFAAFAAMIAWWWFMPDRYKTKKQPETLKEIAAQAEEAVEAIESGEALKNVILRCYFQMTSTLAQVHKLERPAGMTPGEFSRLLVEEGLPPKAVGDLTDLFESVRYGAQEPGPQAEAHAIACLRAVQTAMVDLEPQVAG